MTKKDFALIAQVLRESRPAGEPHRPGAHRDAEDVQWTDIVRKMVATLAAQYPRFNVDKFYAAVLS